MENRYTTAGRVVRVGRPASVFFVDRLLLGLSALIQAQALPIGRRIPLDRCPGRPRGSGHLRVGEPPDGP